jgi:Uncharacterized conserved protein
MTLNRRFLDRMDLCEIDQMIETFKKEGYKKFKSKLVIEIDGYNDDPREIYEIPDISAFYMKVFSKYPYLLYFLSPVHGNDEYILACMCSTHQTVKNAGDNNIRLLMRFKKDLLNYLIDETAHFMNRIGESSRSILELRVRYASKQMND